MDHGLNDHQTSYQDKQMNRQAQNGIKIIQALILKQRNNTYKKNSKG